MTRAEKRNIIISFVLATVSGALIYILDNYFEVVKEWGTEANPFLSYSKLFHYFSTPLLILAIGFIIKSHIIKKIKNLNSESKSRTGLILTIGLVLLIYSGQSLLFVSDVTLTSILIYVHLGLGLLMGAVLIKHLG